jgi:hypothetical protein
MKFIRLTLAIATVLFLSACGSIPPMNFSVPNVGLSQKKIDAELRSMTVTVGRPDEKKGELNLHLAGMDQNGLSAGEQMIPQIWQNSLTEALNRMAIFQDDATKKVNLSVKILKLEVPSMGASFTTFATARYEIMDRKNGDLIYTQDISSSGTTPAGDAFLGLARMRESVNRAVQNSISQFLQALETVDVQKPMFPAKTASSQP